LKHEIAENSLFVFFCMKYFLFPLFYGKFSLVSMVDSLKVKENTRLLAPKRIQGAISGVMRYGYYK